MKPNRVVELAFLAFALVCMFSSCSSVEPITEEDFNAAIKESYVRGFTIGSKSGCAEILMQLNSKSIGVCDKLSDEHTEEVKAIVDKVQFL